MIDKYIYSHNEDLNYFDEKESKIRGKLINPMFIEGIGWYILLFITCILVRKNPILEYLTSLERVSIVATNKFSYLYIVYFMKNAIYGGVILSGISLIIKTIGLYILATNSNDELEMISKKNIFKKWITYIINAIFSISLISYTLYGSKWSYLVIISILLKIIIKLLGMGLSKFRISMINGSLEEAIEEFENRNDENIEDVIGELIGDGKDIEMIWGLGFKHILMETKKLMEKIEEVTKEEKEVFQNKNYLITNLSHDLKTPLTSIINSVYILKNENLDEYEKKEQIQILENKLQRLNNLIKDLNEVVDTDYDGIILNKEEICLNKLILEEINLFDEKFKEGNLDLRINFPEENLNIYADKEKMIRIFENLFMNICKHSLEYTRVYLDMKLDNEYVSVVFKNICKYDIDIDKNTIGNRFVQGDKSRHTEGNGLGLSIVKSLVKLQCGKVDIDINGDLFKVILRFNRLY